jgi:hypothetical protein
MLPPPQKAKPELSDQLRKLESDYPGVTERFRSLQEKYPGFPADNLLLAFAARPDMAAAKIETLLSLYTPEKRYADLKREFPHCHSDDVLRYLAAFEDLTQAAEYIAANGLALSSTYIRVCLTNLLNNSQYYLYNNSTDQPSASLRHLAGYFQCETYELAPEPAWLIQNRYVQSLFEKYPHAPSRSIVHMAARYKSLNDFARALAQHPSLKRQKLPRITAGLADILEGRDSGYGQNYKPTPLGAAILAMAGKSNASSFQYFDPLPNPYWNTPAGREEIIRKNYEALPEIVVDKIVECGGGEEFIRTLLATTQPEVENPSIGQYKSQLDMLRITRLAYNQSGRPNALTRAIATYFDTTAQEMFSRPSYRQKRQRFNPDIRDAGGETDPYPLMPADFCDLLAANRGDFAALIQLLPHGLDVSARSLKSFAETGANVVNGRGDYSREAQAIFHLANAYRHMHGHKPMPIESFFPKPPAAQPGGRDREPDFC